MGSQYAFCEADVAEPTVVIAGREVMIQWFGVVDESLPPRGQFLFPLMNKLEDISWGSDEKFQVVFLDQAKNWPDREVVGQIAEGRADGVEAWVAVLCGHRMVRYPTREGPGTFVGSVVMLGDPKFGIIIPQRYQNLDALERP